MDQNSQIIVSHEQQITKLRSKRSRYEFEYGSKTLTIRLSPNKLTLVDNYLGQGQNGKMLFLYKHVDSLTK